MTGHQAGEIPTAQVELASVVFHNTLLKIIVHVTVAVVYIL